MSKRVRPSPQSPSKIPAGDQLHRTQQEHNTLTTEENFRRGSTSCSITIRGLTYSNQLLFADVPCIQPRRLHNDFHLVHLGSRTVGGVRPCRRRATAVLLMGALRRTMSGFWTTITSNRLRARVARFLEAPGAAPGIRFAHARREAGFLLLDQGGASF